MTEKLSDNLMQKFSDFDLNFAEIKMAVKTAAEESGRGFDDIIILAAIKTVPIELINYAIDKGIYFIAENRVQEFLKKDDLISKEAHRHFIGHLQSNKVKEILGKVEMIESVHSIKLAKQISETSKKLGLTTDILIEINIGEENNKSGFSYCDAIENIETIATFSNIKIKGLMTIPPICTNKEQNRANFSKMKKLFIDIQHKRIDNVSMDFLSMGMSDDFDVAISEGANIVRIGTALFGKRIY